MAQQGDETILEEAKNLLVMGKRAMALEDYQSATDCLEQSCQLFDAFYGVAKRECADAYLEYGLALVALANLEAGSGTDRIMKKAGVEGDNEEEEDEGDDEDDDGDEDDEGDDDGDDEANDDEKQEAGEDAAENKDHNSAADAEKMDTEDGTNNVAENGKTNGSESKQDTTTKTNGIANKNNTEHQPQASSSSGVSEPQPGTSGDQDNKEDVEDEEATTIEIAWEVLCLAKRLFMTDESLEGRMKLAETLQKIGEISIEWDNNDNAVSILEECLNIRVSVLPPEDRLIAVTYYHLGLAHSFKSETQQANESFQNAINVIEKRIASLTADLDKAKEAQDTVTIGAYQKEINELKELLPDMTMRLDDSKEDGAKSTEVLKRTREEMQQEDDEVKKVCLDKSKPVDDISHLVKRKAA